MSSPASHPVRITLADVARQSGLARATVAHVINGRGEELGIRPATRQRVLEAAAALGYRRNAAARAISRGRFNNVTMLLGLNRHFLPYGLLHGATVALGRRDISLSLSELPDEKVTSGGYVPKILRELGSDGLLVNYLNSVPPEMERLMETHRIPAVWINVKRDANCVRPDDRAAGAEATRRLLELGHRRVAMLTTPEDRSRHYSTGDRLAGYAAAMADAGLAPRVAEVTGSLWTPDMQARSSDTRLDGARALLAGPDRPTAVVAEGPALAQPLLLAAAGLGLSVPRDVSVVTFGDWIQDDIGLPVSFMHVSMHEVAERAVDLVCRLIDDPVLELPPVVLPCAFRPGATVAPPPQTP